MTPFAILVAAAIMFLLMISADHLFSLVFERVADKAAPESRVAHIAARVASGVLAPVTAFVLMACGAAVVVPPPQEFTYATIDVNPDATFLQRNAAYVAIETGLADVKVRPGAVYSVATWKNRKGETKTYIGLPGAGKWYSL